MGTHFSHATLEELRLEQVQFIAERDMDRLQSPRNLLFALVSCLGPATAHHRTLQQLVHEFHVEHCV